MSKEKNLPATSGKDIVTVEYNEYDSCSDRDIHVEDRRPSNKLKDLLGKVGNVFRKLVFFIVMLFNRLRKGLSKLKNDATGFIKAESANVIGRLPVLRTKAFTSKLLLSMAALAVYSILCGGIATKNGSASEYMKTFFVILAINGLLIFLAAFLNPYSSGAVLYAFLTSVLITTGVLLQTMLAYTGLTKLIITMAIGVIGGCVGAGGLIFILRSPRRKLFTLIIAVGTVLTVGALAVFGKRINGAANWFEIAGISIQVSELVKVAAVFVFGNIYSFREYSEKKRLALATAYLVALSGVFALAFELGTIMILLLAFVIITFLGTKELKRVLTLTLWGIVAVIIGISVAKSCYENDYDISAQTSTAMQSIELEAYKALSGDKNATADYLHSENYTCVFKEEDAELAPGKKEYVSYSRYIVQSSQQNDEDLGKILNARHLITIVCKNKNSKATANALLTALKSGIEVDENVSLEYFSGITKLENGYYSFEFTLSCLKSIEDLSGGSLMISKLYYKILERLDLAGTQYHSTKILNALRMTNWLGTETNENLLEQIPNKHNDSIFSYALLQLGLGMVLILLFIYAIMLLLTLVNAYSQKDKALSLTSMGFGVCLSIQSIIQLAMSVGVLPIVGMTTAFISQGISSFTASFCMSIIILYAMRKELVTSQYNETTASEIKEA